MWIPPPLPQFLLWGPLSHRLPRVFAMPLNSFPPTSYLLLLLLLFLHLFIFAFDFNHTIRKKWTICWIPTINKSLEVEISLHLHLSKNSNIFNSGFRNSPNLKNKHSRIEIFRNQNFNSDFCLILPGDLTKYECLFNPKKDGLMIKIREFVSIGPSSNLLINNYYVSSLHIVRLIYLVHKRIILLNKEKR